MPKTKPTGQCHQLSCRHPAGHTQVTAKAKTRGCERGNRLIYASFLLSNRNCLLVAGKNESVDEEEYPLLASSNLLLTPKHVGEAMSADDPYYRPNCKAQNPFATLKRFKVTVRDMKQSYALSPERLKPLSGHPIDKICRTIHPISGCYADDTDLVPLWLQHGRKILDTARGGLFSSCCELAWPWRTASKDQAQSSNEEPDKKNHFKLTRNPSRSLPSSPKVSRRQPTASSPLLLAPLVSHPSSDSGSQSLKVRHRLITTRAVCFLRIICSFLIYSLAISFMTDMRRSVLQWRHDHTQLPSSFRAS
jgi:hypothetical protein